jgi:hypothetical protein
MNATSIAKKVHCVSQYEGYYIEDDQLPFSSDRGQKATSSYAKKLFRRAEKYIPPDARWETLSATRRDIANGKASGSTYGYLQRPSSQESSNSRRQGSIATPSFQTATEEWGAPSMVARQGDAADTAFFDQGQLSSSSKHERTSTHSADLHQDSHQDAASFDHYIDSDPVSSDSHQCTRQLETPDSLMRRRAAMAYEVNGGWSEDEYNPTNAEQGAHSQDHSPLNRQPVQPANISNTVLISEAAVQFVTTNAAAAHAVNMHAGKDTHSNIEFEHGTTASAARLEEFAPMFGNAHTGKDTASSEVFQGAGGWSGATNDGIRRVTRPSSQSGIMKSNTPDKKLSLASIVKSGVRVQPKALCPALKPNSRQTTAAKQMNKEDRFTGSVLAHFTGRRPDSALSPLERRPQSAAAPMESHDEPPPWESPSVLRLAARMRNQRKNPAGTVYGMRRTSGAAGQPLITPKVIAGRFGSELRAIGEDEDHEVAKEALLDAQLATYTTRHFPPPMAVPVVGTGGFVLSRTLSGYIRGAYLQTKDEKSASMIQKWWRAKRRLPPQKDLSKRATSAEQRNPNFGYTFGAVYQCYDSAGAPRLISSTHVAPEKAYQHHVWDPNVVSLLTHGGFGEWQVVWAGVGKKIGSIGEHEMGCVREAVSQHRAEKHRLKKLESIKPYSAHG